MPYPYSDTDLIFLNLGMFGKTGQPKNPSPPSSQEIGVSQYTSPDRGSQEKPGFLIMISYILYPAENSINL
jgi:hypothetical protein